MKQFWKKLVLCVLTLALCFGMIPTAFAGQQNSYHPPPVPARLYPGKA